MSRWGIGAAAVLAFTGAPAAGQTYTPIPNNTTAPDILGVIDESDPLDDQGRRYDEYIVEFNPLNDRVCITVEMPTDSVVQVYAPGGQTPVVASDTDPDYPGRTVSLGIDCTEVDAGIYRIRVVGGGSDGRYILRIAVDPRDEGGPGLNDLPAPPTVPARPPNERFIVCPGHPRCPRVR